MPLPFVPGVLKTTFQGRVSGVPWANIFHWQYSSGPIDDTDAQTVATDLLSSFQDFLQPNVSTDVTIDTCVCEGLDSATAGVGAHTSSVNGTETGAALPGNVCFLINHTIARRYRGGHPRTYFVGGPVEALTVPDQWSPGQVANMQTGFNGFVGFAAGISTATAKFLFLSSVSYHSGGIPRVVPIVDTVLGSVAQPLVATQRRRIGR